MFILGLRIYVIKYDYILCNLKFYIYTCYTILLKMYNNGRYYKEIR